MKVHEFLTEDNWTKGAAARNALGKGCPSASPEAVKWCVLGAMIVCYPEDNGERSMKLMDELQCLVPHWNDENDFNTVITKLKELDI
jgi:hypothetical protein